jgi:hypothetical protein
MSDDTDADFDAWLRGSTGRAEPVAPEPGPDIEGVNYPGFGGGRVSAGDPGFGARLPVNMPPPPPDRDGGFSAILRSERDAVRYPRRGEAPDWRT